MYTIIEVQCIDQELTLVEEPVLASGGVNADIIRFTFCELWDGMAKTAVFWNEKRPKDVYRSLIGTNNECIIPHEVLAIKGRFFFGVMGVKDETRKTTTTLAFDLKQGVGKKGILSAPTQTIYEQLLADYAACMDTMKKFTEPVGVKSMTYDSAKNRWTVELSDGNILTADGPAIPDVSGYMPKAGGAFTGAVQAAAADTSGYYVRNIKFSTSAETPTTEGDICFKLA